MQGRGGVTIGSLLLVFALLQVKSKLAELAGDIKRDVAINKDALNAFSECAKIFIHYLTATYVFCPSQ